MLCPNGFQEATSKPALDQTDGRFPPRSMAVATLNVTLCSGYSLVCLYWGSSVWIVNINVNNICIQRLSGAWHILILLIRACSGLKL